MTSKRSSAWSLVKAFFCLASGLHEVQPTDRVAYKGAAVEFVSLWSTAIKVFRRYSRTILQSLSILHLHIAREIRQEPCSHSLAQNPKDDKSYSTDHSGLLI